MARTAGEALGLRFEEEERRMSPRTAGEALGLLSPVMDEENGIYDDSALDGMLAAMRGGEKRVPVVLERATSTLNPQATFDVPQKERDPLNIGTAFSNILPNYRTSMGEKDLLSAQRLEWGLEDAAAVKDQADIMQIVGVTPVEQAMMLRSRGAEMRGDVEAQATIDSELKARAAALRADAERSIREGEAGRTNYEMPDSGILPYVLQAIENSGFSLASGARSGAGWALGGPLGGLLMSLYNTIDESATEAGETARSRGGEGASREEIQRAADETQNRNMALLALSNTVGDTLTFGKLWPKLSEKIGGDGLLSSVARGVVSKGVPVVSNALPEYGEEFGQELIQQTAGKDNVDWSALNYAKAREAGLLGLTGGILHGGAGQATRAGMDTLLGRTEKSTRETEKKPKPAAPASIEEAKIFEDVLDAMETMEKEPPAEQQQEKIVEVAPSIDEQAREDFKRLRTIPLNRMTDEERAKMKAITTSLRLRREGDTDGANTALESVYGTQEAPVVSSPHEDRAREDFQRLSQIPQNRLTRDEKTLFRTLLSAGKMRRAGDIEGTVNALNEAYGGGVREVVTPEAPAIAPEMQERTQKDESLHIGSREIPVRTEARQSETIIPGERPQARANAPVSSFPQEKTPIPSQEQLVQSEPVSSVTGATEGTETSLSTLRTLDEVRSEIKGMTKAQIAETYGPEVAKQRGLDATAKAVLETETKKEAQADALIDETHPRIPFDKMTGKMLADEESSIREAKVEELMSTGKSREQAQADATVYARAARVAATKRRMSPLEWEESRGLRVRQGKTEEVEGLETTEYGQPLNADVDLDAEVGVATLKTGSFPHLNDSEQWRYRKDPDVKKSVDVVSSRIMDRFKNGVQNTHRPDLLLTLSRGGLDHVVDTAVKARGIEGRVLRSAVESLDDLARNAYLVETSRDRYKDEGYSPKTGEVRSVHRFLVPVNYEGDVFVLRMTVKEMENGSREIGSLALYDQKVAKKMPASLPQDVDSKNLVAGAVAGTGKVSIRELVRDVKDSEGNDYFQFAGPKAQTADPLALSKAREMSEKGASNEDVRRETGWFKGMDGKWRFEISDRGSRWIGDASEGMHTGRLGDVIDHPVLFRAYPDLADIPVVWRIGMDMEKPRGTYYEPQKRDHLDLADIKEQIEIEAHDTVEARENLLHEIQHALQARENFARGGSPALGLNARVDVIYKEMVAKVDEKMRPVGEAINDLTNRIKKAEAEGDASTVSSLTEKRSDLWETLDDLQAEKLKLASRAAYEEYYRRAGEIEARDTASRRRLSDEHRRTSEPELRSDAIIVWGGEEMEYRPQATTASKSASDADYLAAVEAGDMEMAQRMVYDAAEAAGYGFSHRRSTEKDPRTTGFVILFSENRDRNSGYGDYEYVAHIDKLPRVPDWAIEWYAKSDHMREWAENYGISDQDEIYKNADVEMNPPNIVYTALFWDSPEWVAQFLQENEDRLLAEGISGFRTPDGAVVFDSYNHPEVVKSAAPITYDDSGNVIPLSRRFDVEKEDVRYQRADSTDAEYLAAVESGNMEEAQNLVDEAARRAGYTWTAVHTTDKEFTAFDKKKATDKAGRSIGFGLGKGKFYFTHGHDSQTATPDKPRKITAYLKIENPMDQAEYESIVARHGGVESIFDLPPGKERDAAFAKADREIKRMGYDGIVGGLNEHNAGKPDALGQIAVIEPSRIKSADAITRDENGDIVPLSKRFDAGKEDIRYQEKKGSIRFFTNAATGEQTQKPIATLFEAADASTFMHESAHHFLNDFLDAMNSQQLEGDTLKEFRALDKWLRFKKDEDGRFFASEEQHERFAVGFEEYLRTGKAPKAAPWLQSVFDKFRAWLTKIFGQARNTGIEMTPEIREIYDSFLTTAEEREVVEEGKTAVVERVGSPLYGAETTVKVPGFKEPLTVRYRVAEASDLVTSHSTKMSVNKEYPADLQPRDRERAASLQQIERMAADLDTDRLGAGKFSNESGAPILAPDGNVVIVGNGRSIAIKAAYERGFAEPYKAWARGNASEFGIDPKAVEGMKQPVLVREIAQEMSQGELVKFANASNTGTNAAMSTVEQAASDAKALDDALLNKLGRNGGLTQDFLHEFMRRVVTDAEKGAFLDADGNPSSAAVDRIGNALFEYAYESPWLTGLRSEREDSDVLTVTNALAKSAGAFAKARLDMKRGDLYEVDLAAPIEEGIRLFQKMKREGLSAKGRDKEATKARAATALNQESLFGEEGDESAAKTIAGYINENSRSATAISKMLNAFVGELRKMGKPSMGLFGEAENTVPLNTLARNAVQAVSSEDEQGTIRFMLAEKEERRTSYGMKDTESPVTLDGLKKSVPGAKVIDIGDGSFRLDLHNGKSIVVRTVKKIDIDPEAVRRDYGREAEEGDVALGATRIVDGKFFVDMVEGLAGEGTLDHELFETAREMVLTDEELLILDREIGGSESQANAYAAFKASRRTDGRVQQIFRKLMDFFARIRASLFGKNSGDVFREVASGRVSKRVGRAGETSSYSLAMQAETRLNEDSAKFGRAVDAFVSGKLNPRQPIPVMTTPLALHLAGAKVLSVTVEHHVLGKVIGKHGLPLSLIKEIPRALANPVMVFASDTRDDSLVVLLDLRDSMRGSVVIPVALERTVDSAGRTVNQMTSAYFREKSSGTPQDKWVTDQIEKGHLRYIDKNKSSAWDTLSGQTFSDGSSLSTWMRKRNFVDENIHTEEDLVKVRSADTAHYSIEKKHIDDVLSKYGTERVTSPLREGQTFREKAEGAWTWWKRDMMDDLSPIKEYFGKDVYMRATNALHGINSRAQALIEFGGEKGQAKSLYDIFGQVPDAEQDGFVHYAVYRHLLDIAENTETAMYGVNDLEKLAEDAERRARAWEKLVAADKEEQGVLRANIKDARDLAADYKAQAEELRKRIHTTRARADQYKAAVKRLEELYPHWKGARKDLVDFSQHLLGKLRDAEVISPELYDALTERYPNYVPLQRDFGTEEAVDGFAKSKGLVNLANPLKRLKGSRRDVLDPLLQIISNVYTIEGLHAKQRVAKEIVGLAEAGEFGDLIVPVEDKHHGPDEHVFHVWENGKKRYFKTDKDVYAALVMSHRSGGNSDNLLWRMLSLPVKMLRAGVTHGITFIKRNPLRDTFNAAVVGDEFVPIVDTLRGMFHVWKKDAVFEEFMRSGAMQGMAYLDMKSRQEMAKVIRHGKGAGNRLRDAAFHPIAAIWEALGDAAQFTELGTRVGQYRKVRNRGGSTEEAAFVSRDLVNYMRGGNTSRTISKFNPFFNAQIQGVAKGLRSFYHDGKLDAKTIGKGLLYISLPSMLMSIWNLGLMDPDDEKAKARREKYLAIPAWQRNLFWNIVIGEGDDAWVLKIPKPFDLGVVFGSIPERAMDYYFAKDERAFKGFGKSLWNAVSPETAPLFMALPFELWTNFSLFFERNIVPMSQERLAPKMQYGAYTYEWAKWAGEKFGLSPRKLEYAAMQLTGNLGKEVMDAADVAFKAVADETRPAKEWYQQIPGISGFAVPAKTMKRWEQTFREERDDLDKMYRTAKEVYKQRGRDGLSNEEKEILGAENAVKRINSYFTGKGGIGDLRSEVNRIVVAKNMSAEEKRRRVDRLESRIQELSTRGLKEIERVMASIERRGK